jgi:hypothetical protein
MNHKEKVAAAAIQVKTLLVIGRHRIDALKNILNATGIVGQQRYNLLNKVRAGFVTTLGRFVDAEEAYAIANAQGQVGQPFDNIAIAKGLLGQRKPGLDPAWLETDSAQVNADTILDYFEQAQLLEGAQKQRILNQVQIMHHLFIKNDFIEMGLTTQNCLQPAKGDIK